MGKINIEINEDFDIQVCTKDKNGLSSKKVISLDTLFNILETCRGKVTKRVSTVKKDLLYMSPLMPSLNGVHVLQHIIKNEGKEIVVLQREARRSKVAFYDNVIDNVGMPSLIFAISLVDGVIQTARVMAIKDKVVREDSKLYRYPLSNVSENGAVCFGGNNLRQFKMNSGDLNNIHSFPSMFLMMPSTHEVAYQNKYGLKLRPLLEYLQGKDFDDDKLSETSYTYKSWINSIL